MWTFILDTCSEAGFVLYLWFALQAGVSAYPPHPPVSNECRVQRTLLFGPFLFRTKLLVGHGEGGGLSASLAQAQSRE
jgi:hypothetical protein